MKNPFPLQIRKLLIFPFGICMVLAAGFLGVRSFPRSLWPTLIVAGVSCVVIAGLLLIISAQKDVRDALGCAPETDIDSDQEDHPVSSKVEKFQPLGLSAGVSIIQPAQDARKKSLRAEDADEEDRAA